MTKGAASYAEEENRNDSCLYLERYPETEDEANLVEESLAQAMAKLSVEEEDRILFDMYGFPSGTGEDDHDESLVTPNSSLLARHRKEGEAQQRNSKNTKVLLLEENHHGEQLRQLENALKSCLPTVHESVRKTYERTVKINPSFLRQQGMFFIAAVKDGDKDNFSEAAKLVLDHLEVKSEIFPESVISRHVRWTDLTEREQEIASYGCYQFASTTDAFGRMVFHWSAHRVIEILDQNKDEDLGRILQRTVWYTLMTGLRSTSQALKNGVVLSMCSITSRIMPFQINKVCLRMLWRIPFRFQCWHVFHTSPTLHIRYKALQLLNIFMKGTNGVRINVHMSSSIPEIKDKMMSMGLDPAASPWAQCNSNDAKDWSRQNHLEWLERQRTRERQEVLLPRQRGSADATMIRPLDVLLGRSKMCAEHTGTKRCKVLVTLKQEAYEATNAQGKTRIANEIIDAIGQSGGRFLRFHNEKWSEVSSTVARQKVAHYFRFLRSKGRED